MLQPFAIEGFELQVQHARILIEGNLVEYLNHSKAGITPSLHAIDRQ
jgi:hypothetical protein